MRKNAKFLLISAGLVLTLALLVGVAVAGPPRWERNLTIVSFDPIGEPGDGQNAELALDADAGFAYVGGLFGDNTVKTVDVSDPTAPQVTDVDSVNGSPFDVKIAGDVLAAGLQIISADDGVVLFDITNRSSPVQASTLSTTDIQGAGGSHNLNMWHDDSTGQTWLFVCGLGGSSPVSMNMFDVSDPYNPIFTAGYDNGGPTNVHDCFTQENNGRVMHYQAGAIGAEILDVTSVVRGGQPGPLGPADVLVGKNHYTSDPADASIVTRPGFAHYPEPTASGDVLWVGDESGCGQAAIVHSFDASDLPAPGNPPKLLEEYGTIVSNPDVVQCAGAINSNPDSNANPQLHNFRWTGHNFDVWGEELLVRGNYGKGVDVWDISDPANAVLVAESRGLNRGVGAANAADPGRNKAFEHYPWIWSAIYDGDTNLIYAPDIVQGLYILELVER